MSLPQRCVRQLLREPFQRSSLPIFLAPAFSSSRSQCFSTTSPAQSRVGGAPISIPPEVTFNLVDLPETLTRTRGKDIPKFAAEIKGPRGEMSVNIPSFLNVTRDETGQKATLSVQDTEIPHQRAMWGTIRALIQNNILGVSEGHVCVLSMVGVGYRATVEETATTVESTYPGQKFVSLKVGYSHPIELGIPKGVEASTPQPTRILLEGVDKRVVTQFAAEIRDWRRPEPYKGKGIFVNGETIKLKAKKIK
ncbi:unnamed protein product [Penicillium salamii]|uniref:Large ribosomal subunit protein uL6m n=1 Tax=Penicillium salamii TaxID=1612424 RepID=A0A9W4JQ44_9EURO|nr:unnamed protein product [Penicillium salamii]CAG8039784.1 unnamed protein product [Penicillium salamii]CAG8051921.1 unnamed protein product [Penicillium salamii]CAG8117765.1 unnamed protein product [Penicillium salamii]CAG8257277.1 unnamed protein product [Penicillium salamii]